MQTDPLVVQVSRDGLGVLAIAFSILSVIVTAVLTGALVYFARQTHRLNKSLAERQRVQGLAPPTFVEAELLHSDSLHRFRVSIRLQNPHESPLYIRWIWANVLDDEMAGGGLDVPKWAEEPTPGQGFVGYKIETDSDRGMDLDRIDRVQFLIEYRIAQQTGPDWFLSNIMTSAERYPGESRWRLTPVAVIGFIIDPHTGKSEPTGYGWRSQH